MRKRKGISFGKSGRSAGAEVVITRAPELNRHCERKRSNPVDDLKKG
jgi:hypothetical protein